MAFGRPFLSDLGRKIQFVINTDGCEYQRYWFIILPFAANKDMKLTIPGLIRFADSELLSSLTKGDLLYIPLYELS